MTSIVEDLVTPQACPVCDGLLHALGPRRWGCEQGHTVTHCPELLDTLHRNRVELGWAEDLSPRPELSSAGEMDAQSWEADHDTWVEAEIPLPSPEDIASSKAEWERKLKRKRQRRWRARKRAGLV